MLASARESRLGVVDAYWQTVTGGLTVALIVALATLAVTRSRGWVASLASLLRVVDEIRNLERRLESVASRSDKQTEILSALISTLSDMGSQDARLIEAATTIAEGQQSLAEEIKKVEGRIRLMERGFLPKQRMIHPPESDS